jgi:hypothetical protein
VVTPVLRKRGKFVASRLQAGQARAEVAVADARFSARRNSSLVTARARRRVKHWGIFTPLRALVYMGLVIVAVEMVVATAAG